MNETDIIQVYTPNGAIKNVRYDFETKTQRVVNVVLTALGIDRVSFGHFALRIIPFPVARVCSSDNECSWLHPSLTMRHIYGKYFSNSSLAVQLRFELRLRFVPRDLQEMYQTEMDAFMFLHDQVLADYMTQVSWKVPVETAVELASLQIRRSLGDQNACTIDKCLNMDEIEAQGMLKQLLPESLLVNMKPKVLKKALLAGVRRHASLSPKACAIQFLGIIRRITQFDTEIFKASLGPTWKTPMEAMIGLNVGLSYSADDRCGPTLLTKLQHVVELTMSKSNDSSDNTIVQLKLSGSSQHLSFTLPTYQLAESFAHLINGYKMLLSQQGPIWTPTELLEELKAKEAKVTFDDEGGWSALKGTGLRITRSCVTLEELLGDGQFGNVYKGSIINEEGLKEAVAVKACKVDSEPNERHKFLEEAFVMHRFHHEHIIALIGICTEAPVWIVMELAPFGELRQYLLHNRSTIDLSIQLLFSHQLSSAVLYLHTCKYVHRDIATRNVLVSTPRSVKLSDFGLSRCVEDENFYTSSHGKLPIKWMAPESINYRKFSTATDVWMFGVCIWEIMSCGIKPWQGVKNHNVILELEAGERLEIPESCPPALYNFLLKMWDFEPSGRPTICEVNCFLGHLLDQIDCRVPYDMLTAPSPDELSAMCLADEQANAFLKIAPVLRVDASSVAPSTLWRALEQQRIQSEEDDRWLEEEEEKLLPLATLSSVRSQHLNSLSKKPLGVRDGIPQGYEFDRTDDKVHDAVFKVVEAITTLSREYLSDMNNARFADLVQVITDAMKNLLDVSRNNTKALNTSDQEDVKLVEGLLESDQRNLSSNMQRVLDEDISEDNYEDARREVLKVTHRLAFNCKQFLESIDNTRLRSGIAKLRPRSSQGVQHQL